MGAAKPSALPKHTKYDGLLARIYDCKLEMENVAGINGALGV